MNTPQTNTDVQIEDRLVGRFLEFLAKDIQQRPEVVKPLSRGIAARLSALTKGKRKRVDIEAPIEGAVDL